MPYTSIQQVINKSATDDISTLDDDTLTTDHDNSYGRVYKRRKLKLELTSTNPSPQLPIDKGIFKKRYNDCDDYEHRHER